MRETYDVLSWLGDIGGLTDALRILAQLLLRPFTSFHFASFLLSKLFLAKPDKSKESTSSRLQSLRRAFYSKRRIRAESSYLYFIAQSCCQKERY